MAASRSNISRRQLSMVWLQASMDCNHLMRFLASSSKSLCRVRPCWDSFLAGVRFFCLRYLQIQCSSELDPDRILLCRAAPLRNETHTQCVQRGLSSFVGDRFWRSVRFPASLRRVTATFAVYPYAKSRNTSTETDARFAQVDSEPAR
jgi:hypothetical protein